MAVEKLMDLSKPIDVPLLDATVTAFYGTGSKEERTAADHILRELQNNLDMWLQVVHILQSSQNLNTKFFALQVEWKTLFVFVDFFRSFCNLMLWFYLILHLSWYSNKEDIGAVNHKVKLPSTKVTGYKHLPSSFHLVTVQFALCTLHASIKEYTVTCSKWYWVLNLLQV